MKKILSFLVIIPLLTSLFSMGASASSNVKIYINGAEMTFATKSEEPYIDSQTGRAMVPLRFVSEELGTNVHWDSKTNKITITGDYLEIDLTVGSKNVTVNGTKKTIDAIVTIKTGSKRTFVPLRFINEALGGKVEYDNTSGSVLISTVPGKGSDWEGGNRSMAPITDSFTFGKYTLIAEQLFPSFKVTDSQVTFKMPDIKGYSFGGVHKDGINIIITELVPGETYTFERKAGTYIGLSLESNKTGSSVEEYVIYLDSLKVSDLFHEDIPLDWVLKAVEELNK